MARNVALILAAAVACPAGAQAPDGQAGEGSEIVVEANRDRDREIKTFVDALTPSRVRGQLSRFNNKVCPAAVGLPSAQTGQVVARLRAVATAAGIGVAKTDCVPNALVIVVADKDKFMAELRTEHPGYFVDPVDMPVRIPKESGPAVSWQINGLLDSDGIKAPVAKPPTGGKYYVVSSTTSSRLKPSSRPEFLTSVLVIDIDALSGLTTTQLADYSAMRLYSQANPKRLANHGQQTILKVIDAPLGSATPLTLTAWDLTFLKSLYATDPLTYANQQRGAINRQFRRELQTDR